MEDKKNIKKEEENKKINKDIPKTKDSNKKEEKVDYKEKYLKLLADMENLRKRFDEERMQIIKYRASSFIQEILPTLDMFEMALSSKDVSDEIKNWLIGFEMILNNFNTTLKSEGVTEIEVKVGDLFNSNHHQGIEEVESNKFKPGEIVSIKSKGYLLHGRLLRPTTVVVAKDKNKINKIKGDKNE